MKISFKAGMLWLSLMSGLSLAGCGGLSSDALNIELEAEDTSNWWSGNQTSTVVRVRSTVAEDITIQNVSINNGIRSLPCRQLRNSPHSYYLSELDTVK